MHACELNLDYVTLKGGYRSKKNAGDSSFVACEARNYKIMATDSKN